MKELSKGVGAKGWNGPGTSRTRGREGQKRNEYKEGDKDGREMSTIREGNEDLINTKYSAYSFKFLKLNILMLNYYYRFISYTKVKWYKMIKQKQN